MKVMLTIPVYDFVYYRFFCLRILKFYVQYSSSINAKSLFFAIQFSHFFLGDLLFIKF